MTPTETTEDALLDGRIRIRQPAQGYRVNVDTLLLAAAVEAPNGARLLEAGCGVGVGLIAVAARSENTTLVGVERDQNIAEIARENVAMNAMMQRIEIVSGDVLERNANVTTFDGVFCNPPFDQAGEGRAPAPHRARAHIADEPLDRWLAVLADRLRGGAALTLIYRARKLSEVLAGLEGRLGGVEILPIRPRAESEASRVIVRARKGSRAPLRLLPGLDLHDGSGSKHTPEVEAIVRGQALISWD
ncbi:MAG: methyltransferase [Hyphomonadaceae bacterium]|nr:methyltransferase [Hyphomonadaceae bacterium]